jgi:hypothetical protein
MMLSGSKCMPSVVAILGPERDAGILALMARAIGRRLRVLEDAIVSDQVPQRGGIVTEEDVVEALQDRFGSDALGIVETATGHGRLRCWFIYVPFRI